MNNSDKYVLEVNSNFHKLSTSEIDTLDLIKKDNGFFHYIENNQCYIIEIISTDFYNKIIELKINGNTHLVSIKDQFDLLVKEMGLSISEVNDIKEIHAPMPGLVLSLEVNVSDDIKKGDTLLILEAMKMENMIKSPVDGVIKNITVEKGQAVDKGLLLIEFE